MVGSYILFDILLLSLDASVHTLSFSLLSFLYLLLCMLSGLIFLLWLRRLCFGYGDTACRLWCSERNLKAVLPFRIVCMIWTPSLISSENVCLARVDNMWHTHLAFPCQYLADCRGIAGRTIHDDDDVGHDRSPSSFLAEQEEADLGSLVRFYQCTAKGGGHVSRRAPVMVP